MRNEDRVLTVNDIEDLKDFIYEDDMTMYDRDIKSMVETWLDNGFDWFILSFKLWHPDIHAYKQIKKDVEAYVKNHYFTDKMKEEWSSIDQYQQEIVKG